MSGLVGQIVKDTYHFTEYIGRGGMADVYKVWDAQRVIHLAAKVLHKDMALDKVFLRRFEREAETLTQLQHPHIVRSYGLQLDGRLAFLLMDFVEGESLKELIFDADGPLPLEQIRGILRPVAGALHYAHSQGFVHCDIKPANIMLDKYGEVRLADFGIARMTDAATATMVGAGTPAYMAPEQVKGLDPTPQTDIYALGIVLFEMLTGGERPFTGELAEVTGSTGEKVRWEQIRTNPPSMKRWNPNISPELDALVQKCLAKNPADRYQNPLDVLNDFGRAIGDVSQNPVMVKPPQPSFQPRKPASPPSPQPARKSKKLPVGIYVMGGIVLFGVLFFSVLGSSRPIFATPPVEMPTKEITTPLSTKVPEIIETKTQIPAPEKTETLVPTETHTPVPTFTPTVAPPVPLQKYLDDVRVTYIDDFSSDSGWDLGVAEISDGVLELTGRNWNGFTGPESFPEGTGFLIKFKFSKGAVFQAYYNSGEWQTDNYRRFGIYYRDDYPKADLWLGRRALGYKNLPGTLDAEYGIWYTLLMATDTNGELLAVIWETSHPEKASFYHETNPKWAGYDWTFRIGADEGSITFDDFMEITFSDINIK